MVLKDLESSAFRVYVTFTFQIACLFYWLSVVFWTGWEVLAIDASIAILRVWAGTQRTSLWKSYSWTEFERYCYYRSVISLNKLLLKLSHTKHLTEFWIKQLQWKKCTMCTLSTIMVTTMLHHVSDLNQLLDPCWPPSSNVLGASCVNIWGFVKIYDIIFTPWTVVHFNDVLVFYSLNR